MNFVEILKECKPNGSEFYENLSTINDYWGAMNLLSFYDIKNSSSAMDL